MVPWLATERGVGAFFNVCGAVANDFGMGKQFVRDVPPEKEFNVPATFPGEDCIIHAGTWLFAISRKNPSPTMCGEIIFSAY